jgi:hypothetical protein
MSEKDIETEVVPTAMVLASESASLSDLSDLGFITPIATPSRLRAAFAEKQRLYAAILDESDYIYTVSYVENGKTRQNIYTRREDAEKAAKAYLVDIRASPKKSGIVKLASALGIEARRRVTRGLPEDPTATYSYVSYEAMHKRTGRSEEGIGWCDKTERGGRISSHDVIATADTRAYNRAILRLAGFGDVSADEIVPGASGDEAPQAAVEAAPKKPLALPAPVADEVVTAQRWWAEESAKREAGFLPDAQQGSKVGRELRARARRGNETAARQMGSLGYGWQGTAQDSISHETFEVEAPTITVADFERIKAAVGDPTKAGWDLSGTGNAHEENRTQQDKPVTREQAAAEVPAAGIAGYRGTSRDGSVETITTIQAKALSLMLLDKLGTKDAAQAWLRKHADVERSSLVRQNQLDNLKNLLTKET